jgi:hypothetical protein
LGPAPAGDAPTEADLAALDPVRPDLVSNEAEALGPAISLTELAGAASRLLG